MKLQPKLSHIIAGIVFVLTVSCGRKVSPSTSPGSYEQTVTVEGAEPRLPQLVVLISVDQMRASYLDRFSELYTGGLKRLRDQGVVFADAHHEHALTLTAPGHATISTGCHPKTHGIIANDFYNRVTRAMEYSVEDPNVKAVGLDYAGPSHSPVNLAVPAIGDRLKKEHRRAKVYSVAFKDRSSILLAGQQPDQAYWYDDVSGFFISSAHYGPRLPRWVTEWNGKERMRGDIEDGWHKKLQDDSLYERLAGPDAVVQENARFLPQFPHTKVRMGGFVRPEYREREMLWTTPFGDKMTLAFARDLVEQNDMGADEVPDLLLVSCSTADAIGHHFGPDSQEVMDYYLRLDDYLEEFFQYLDNKVGPDRYLVVLSADHGVVTMPELAAAEGVDAKRIITVQFRSIMERLDGELRSELGLSSPLIHSANFTGVSLNYEEAGSKGIAPAELRVKVAESLKALDFVADAFTLEELESAADRPYLELYRRSTFPGRGHDIKLRYKKHYLVDYSSNGSSHGSPYDYDSHVPMVYYGMGLPAKRIERRVATIDIAPTLARLLRLGADKTPFDGQVLPEVTLSPGN